MTLPPRWRRSIAWSGLVLALALLATASFFGVRGLRDVAAYREMPTTFRDTPVWKDLALRRIRAGHPLDRLLAVSRPDHICPHDGWTTVRYGALRGDFTGLTVIARGDRLAYASAWSCTFDHVFFDEMPAEEWPHYEASYREFVKQYVAERRARREILGQQGLQDYSLTPR